MKSLEIKYKQTCKKQNKIPHDKNEFVWDTIFFFLCGKRTSFFPLTRSWLSSERLFLHICTYTHSSLLSVCVWERDRHTDTETGSFSFWEKIYTFGVVRRQTPQNSDFVGTHTHTHNFQIQKGGESGCEFSLQHPSFGGSFVSRDNVLLRKPSRRRRHFPFADRFFVSQARERKRLDFRVLHS